MPLRRTICATAIAALFAAFLMVSATSAYAADALKTAPTVLQSVGFESPADNLALYSGDLPGDLATAVATWDRASAEHQTGSYGLWCAGSVPGDFPHYPSPTRGLANFVVGDTSNYYESWIQYSYIEPSYGALETINPFRTNWIGQSVSATGSTPPGSYFDAFRPITPVWQTVTAERIQDGALPRTAGSFRFLFYTSEGDTSTAEGATIDDVMSTAYMFGPAVNVTAVRGASPHSSVTVSWGAAWAPNGATPYYAVWRHDVAADTWTEITPARVSGPSVVDTGAVVSRTYEYAVQAWDGSTSSANWGPLALSQQAAPVPATSITGTFAGSQTSTTAAYNGKLAVTGTLADVDGVALSGLAGSVVVQTSPNNSAWTTASPAVASAAVAAGTGSYTATVTVTAPGYFRLSFGGASGYSASVSGPGLQVALRNANTSWGAPAPNPASPRYNSALTITASLGSESGSMPSRAGLVALQTSPNGSTWTTVSASAAPIAENSASTYSASVVATQTQYYRLVYSGELNYNGSASAPVQVAYTQAGNVTFTGVTVSTTTPPYLGTFTVGANMGSDSGAVTGRSTVRVTATQGGTAVSGAGPWTAVEDTPGHYIAYCQLPYIGTALDLRFTFAGDAQYSASAGLTSAARTPNVTTRQATMSFSNVTASPAVVIAGNTSTVSGDLLAETGAAVQSGDASVTLLQSNDNVNWTTFANSLVDSTTAGHYAAVVSNVQSHQYFRFIVAAKGTLHYVPVSGNATSAAAEVTATANPATSVSGTFADGTTSPISVLYGTGVKLTGTLRDAGGVALFGHAGDVAVQTSPSGLAGTWTIATPSPTIGSTVESITSPGSYEVTVTANSLSPTYYRLQFGGSGALLPSASSPALAITGTQATTAWSAPQLSAGSVFYGDSASVASTLSAASGPIAGRLSGVGLQSSPDGATWTTATVAIAEDAPGHYTATLPTLTSARYYRFRFSGEIALTSATSASSAQLAVNALTSAWTFVPATLSFPYLGQAVLSGSLAATAPLTGQAAFVTLQTSPNGTTGWISAAANVVEDAPAHYAASFLPSGTGGYFRLAFAGVGGVYTSATSNAVQVGSTVLPTGWTGGQDSVEPVAFGGSTVLSAQLQTATALAGEGARVTLQSSADGATWSPETASIAEPLAGTYSVTLASRTAPGVRYYRFHFAGEASKYDASDSSAITVTVDKDVAKWAATGSTPGGQNAGIGTLDVWGELLDSANAPLTGAVSLQEAPANDPTTWSDAGASAVAPSADHAPANYEFRVSVPTTDTYFRLVYAGDVTHQAASWTSAKISVSQPVPHFIASSISPTSPGYGAVATLRATVSLDGSTPTTDLAGSALTLQYSMDGGAHFADLGAPSVSGTDFSAATRPVTERVWYRLHANNTPTNPEFFTPWFGLLPPTYLSVPSTPPKVTHNKAFSVTGKVSGVSVAVRVITLRAEHKESKVVKKKKTTVWVVRSTATVSVRYVSGTTSYKVSMKLKQTGSWRIRAAVSDAYSVPTTTGYRSFSAK